jgi:hypothetical protein
MKFRSDFPKFFHAKREQTKRHVGFEVLRVVVMKSSFLVIKWHVVRCKSTDVPHIASYYRLLEEN